MLNNIAVSADCQSQRGKTVSKGITRRAVLAGFAGVAAGAAIGGCSDPGASMKELWAVYLERFVTSDGRVVDSYNKGVSHSESQGWGMLLAAAAEDWQSFDRIWGWTRDRLAWEGAPLFAWAWDPDAAAVSDANDASDGDILIAWALSRAAIARKDNGLAAESARTAEAVRRLLVARLATGVSLLPGFYGFDGSGPAVLNLSYYVFPAFWHFTHSDGDPVWSQLSNDGAALARAARFGPDALTPDWLEISPDGALAPAPNWPARFGFDAVRVPLYLYWAGFDSDADLGVYRRIWQGEATPPAWFALDDGPDATDPAPAGMRAIAELVTTGQRPTDATLWSAVRDGEYYSASLALLAALAADERQQS